MNIHSKAARIWSNYVKRYEIEDEQSSSTYFKHLLQKTAGSLSVFLWRLSGSPSPPPHNIKARCVIEHRTKIIGNCALVETGTYLGRMLSKAAPYFDEVYTIELDQALFERAKRNFGHLKQLTCLNGDSSEVLTEFLPKINLPCVFWLDAHYSGGVTARGLLDTPIRKEIEAIMRHPIKNHVILIDDARDFSGNNDYPTISVLSSWLKEINGNYVVEVKDDIVRAYLP
jgi:hypothetical protein